jgi:DNA-directed RNA polymerase subunit RPC12/RpoP
MLTALNRNTDYVSWTLQPTTAMMGDSARDSTDSQDERPTSPARWAAFLFLAVIGVLVIYGTLLVSSYEVFFGYTVLMLPLVVLMLCAAFRWAQGHSIAPVDEAQDSEIFASMTRHALPAQQTGGIEMFRCPECGMSFELANATQVEDHVVLCPVCGARLFIG